MLIQDGIAESLQFQTKEPSTLILRIETLPPEITTQNYGDQCVSRRWFAEEETEKASFQKYNLKAMQIPQINKVIVRW